MVPLIITKIPIFRGEHSPWINPGASLASAKAFSQSGTLRALSLFVEVFMSQHSKLYSTLLAEDKTQPLTSNLQFFYATFRNFTRLQPYRIVKELKNMITKKEMDSNSSPSLKGGDFLL